jgi:hypothetical protein
VRGRQPLAGSGVASLNLYYAELQASYAAKRELFLGFLRQSGLCFTEPEGA